MTSNIANAYLGSTPLKAIYVGDKKVYPEAEPFHAQFDLSQGTSSTTLSLPIPSNSNLRIDWGDGTETISGNSHTYDTIGVYDVKIYGQIRDFSYVNGGQAQKLMRIFNWGQFIITTIGVFIRCSNLIIEDLETKVNVETTDMTAMFGECSSLTTIPLLDTSNVTNMSSMFGGCSALTEIPLLDTSNVTNMSHMFYSCSSLTTIPLLDTSKVTNMRQMFYSCSSLTSIPLLDTSNVIDMSDMFIGCGNLTLIPLLDTSNVINMSDMFRGCRNLTLIPLLVTSKVTTMRNMFNGCSSLTTIPLLDTSNVTIMPNMFYDCSNLTSIPDLDTSSVTNMSYMFYGCSKLDADLSGWCVPKITSLPSNFVTGAPLMTAEKLPVWGTCP